MSLEPTHRQVEKQRATPLVLKSLERARDNSNLGKALSEDESRLRQEISDAKFFDSNHNTDRMLLRHFKILELRLAGMSVSEIAKVVGVTRDTVHNIVRSPVFIAEYNRRSAEVVQNAEYDAYELAAEKAREKLAAATTTAADKQIQLLESEDESIQLRASNSILDRALGKARDAITNVNVGVGVQISDESAKIIVTALKESKLNGYKQKPSTDREDADSSEDRQGDVHQASEVCTRERHWEAEAQDRTSEVVVVDSSDVAEDCVLTLPREDVLDPPVPVRFNPNGS